MNSITAWNPLRTIFEQSRYCNGGQLHYFQHKLQYHLRSFVFQDKELREMLSCLDHKTEGRRDISYECVR